MEKTKNRPGGGRGRISSRGGKRISIITRQFSAGGVVFKKENGKTLWLIAKNTPSADFPKILWRLQKGWLDDENDGPGKYARGDKKASEEILQKAALREVAEEGGVEAKIIKKIETTRFFFTTPDKTQVVKFVTYYLMEYVSDAFEGFGPETSEVKWLPYEEAKKTLSISGERKILDKAVEMVNSGIQDSLI